MVNGFRFCGWRSVVRFAAWIGRLRLTGQIRPSSWLFVNKVLLEHSHAHPHPQSVASRLLCSCSPEYLPQSLKYSPSYLAGNKFAGLWFTVYTFGDVQGPSLKSWPLSFEDLWVSELAEVWELVKGPRLSCNIQVRLPFTRPGDFLLSVHLGFSRLPIYLGPRNTGINQQMPESFEV